MDTGGGRRYACPEEGCDKVFSSSSHMRRHVRNHRDDRAFSCTHCGQAFIRREVWKRHEALHINPQSSRPRIKPVRQVEDATPPQSAIAGPSNVGTSFHHAAGPVKLEGLTHGGVLRSPVATTSAIPTAGALQSNVPPNPLTHPQPLPFHERMASEADQFSSHSSSPLYLSFPSSSHSQPPNPQPHLVHQWPVGGTGFPQTEASHTLFPQLGIENWLDQILSDQATFSTAVGPSSSHQHIAQPFWGQHTAGPSPEETEACRRLQEWFSEHGGRQHAAALDPKRFARCLGAYWMNIDVQYPIIHAPTFSKLGTPPLLLLAIVLLGATTTAVDHDWSWAEGAFPIARGLAFGQGGTDARDRLHNLESLALLSIVGHSMGQDAQDHGQALISAALTLARRANLYEDRSRSTKTPPALGASDDVQAQWHHWIHEESARRVAWMILMRDIEYASFFHQIPSRATSPFRLPVDLPSAEICWEAPTAEAWSRTYIVGETLAVALKKAMQQGARGYEPHAPDTEFAQLVLIYGLCALGWDVHKRDLIAPEVVTSDPTALTSFLLRSFTAYALESRPPPRNRKQDCLQKCVQDVAFLAALECHMNTPLLQVFFGVPEIGNMKPVRPTDWVEARKVMGKWAQSEDSGLAVALSTQFIGHAIRTAREPTLNGAWAIYNAFLVCWTYFVLARTNTAPPLQSSTEVTSKHDALQCLQTLQAWARSAGEEPDAALMRALCKQVVVLLSGRQEVMVKDACTLIDRQALV